MAEGTGLVKQGTAATLKSTRSRPDGQVKAGEAEEEAAAEGEAEGEEGEKEAEECEEHEEEPTEPAPIFTAEPLHVRTLVQEERRKTVKKLKDEEEALTKKQAELATIDKSRKEEEWQIVSDDVARTKYNLKMLKLRMKHIEALNPKTYEELPFQMIDAALHGDHSWVQLGAVAKVPLDLTDDKGMTALIAATVANKVSVVKVLVQFRADLSVQDQNGATCLHYAVQLNHVQVLAALLDVRRGGHWDVLTVPDARGWSTIDYARREDRQPCQQLLRNRLGGPGQLLWLVWKHSFRERFCCASCSTVTKARPQTVPQVAPLP